MDLSPTLRSKASSDKKLLSPGSGGPLEERNWGLGVITGTAHRQSVYRPFTSPLLTLNLPSMCPPSAHTCPAGTGFGIISCLAHPGRRETKINLQRYHRRTVSVRLLPPTPRCTHSEKLTAMPLLGRRQRVQTPESRGDPQGGMEPS